MAKSGKRNIAPTHEEWIPMLEMESDAEQAIIAPEIAARIAAIGRAAERRKQRMEEKDKLRSKPRQHRNRKLKSFIID